MRRGVRTHAVRRATRGEGSCCPGTRPSCDGGGSAAKGGGNRRHNESPQRSAWGPMVSHAVPWGLTGPHKVAWGSTGSHGEAAHSAKAPDAALPLSLQSPPVNPAGQKRTSHGKVERTSMRHHVEA
jgi:hypothetical protein